jgi:glycosyltransferase involved in cell wall biosynthesis
MKIPFLINSYFKKELENELRKQKNIINNEKYYKICNKGILLNKKKFKKVKEPKISIISPIYNKEKYIIRFLRSIQNQFFDEIEIILVDDCSKDNSISEIQNLQKKDERIILIMHNNNRGTLITRNEGSMISRGKYLIFGDPDDLFLMDIFDFCFNIGEKNNFDMIRYNIYNGNNTINLDFIVNNLDSREICQPELSLYLFYGLGELREIDYFIWNKFIKKDIFILALKKIDKFYLNQYMIDCEDGLINFMLHRTANSYYFTKKIGYYYILNNDSITYNNKENFSKRIRSNFLYFKFIIQYTQNNERDKKIAEYLFFTIYENFQPHICDILKGFKKDMKFYEEIINLYLNCEYISKEKKNILKELKLCLNNSKS